MNLLHEDVIKNEDVTSQKTINDKTYLFLEKYLCSENGRIYFLNL